MDEPKQDYIGNYTQDFQPSKQKPRRYLWLAIASALIPGLGQMIKGDYVKGVLFLLIVPLIFLFLPRIVIIVVFDALLWIFNIVDAYTHTVKKRIYTDPI